MKYLWSKSRILILALLAPAITFGSPLKLAMQRGSEITNISYCVIKKAYERINIELSITPLPSTRSLTFSDVGKFEGEVSRISTLDKPYPNLVKIPIPTSVLTAVALSKNSSITPNGFKSLKEYRIIINRGALFSKANTKGFPKVDMTDSYDAVFKMLNLGRADIAIAPLSNSMHLIKKLKLEKEIHPLSPALMEINMYHFLHKNKSNLIPKITKTLKEMQDKGEIKKIAKMYRDNIKNNVLNSDKTKVTTYECPSLD